MKNIFLAFFLFLITQKAFPIPVAIVSHHWITKIADSRNNVTIRPGSVYEINTYFEQHLRGFRPKFKYIFRDTGLGTADPIYPIFQEGYQKSWFQLLPAMASDKKRHIDHYSVVDVPEGCRVYSAYWVRHIDEFPDQYHELREDGYVLVDTGFDYYESENPNAECGKHIAHPPIQPPEIHPLDELKEYAKKYRSYDDIPEELLSKFESKIGILKLVTETFSRKKWPRYDDVYSLEANSMWYYPKGFSSFYGLDNAYPQINLNYASKPSDYFVPTTEERDKLISLEKLISENEWNLLQDHLNGKPHSNFDSENEPGKDTLSLDQIEDMHIYTYGTDLWKIENADSTVSNPKNYKFVSMIIRPYEWEPDVTFGERIVPQVRFVFQMKDPNKDSLTEQVYLHVQFDAIDRYASKEIRDTQHKEFLHEYNILNSYRTLYPKEYNPKLMDFIKKYASRKTQTIAYSSTLTGIWVFGSISRSFNTERKMQSVDVTRKGINVGHYSTIWDSQIFRDEVKNLPDDSERKKELEKHMSYLTPDEYRDPKRHDVNNITFKDMTCAQCHQMAGRDGVHISINDNVDSRVKTTTKHTQFFVRELAKQLKFGETYWK